MMRKQILSQIGLTTIIGKNKYSIVTVASSIFLVATLLFLIFATNIFTAKSAPKYLIDGDLAGRSKYSYVQKDIDPKKGGEIESVDKQVKLSLPQDFAKENLTVSMREVSDENLKVNNKIGPMYEITAYNSKGEEVSTFDKDLTLETTLMADQLKNYDTNNTGTYFFNVENNKWEKLISTITQDNKIVASTNHFTVFASTIGDPNGDGTGIVAAAATGLAVDDSDPSPLFVWKNLGDDDQPAYKDTITTGYNRGATVTGNSINSNPHNSGTWNASGLTGTMDVSVTIPTVSYCTPKGTCAPLTTLATYKITHAGGVDTKTVNQFASQGKTILLGNYTFAGSGKVELTDVVAESGASFKSFVVYDAVFFGDVPTGLDITPPLIEDVKAMTHDGMFTIQAKVTDLESGVGQVVLFLTRGNGTVEQYEMILSGDDIYSVSVPGIKPGETLDYKIGAIDNAGNESSWDRKNGYVTRGINGRFLGFHPGMIYRSRYVGNRAYRCNPTCAGKTQEGGDPVNTLNGNLIEQYRLVDVAGRPEIDLYLTYNSQGGRMGIFGESWTHNYAYHLIDMDNPGFSGAFVQYPDGFIAQFNGSGNNRQGYTAEAGVHEKLVKTGDGYELIFTDLRKVIFDEDGDIVRWQDANNNGLNFDYSQKIPFTTMSQISKITADGGRKVEMEYNADGLVSKVKAAESINIDLNYTNADLTKVTDARSNVTGFEYEDHNLTKKVSPEGHNYYENQYDDERRVTKQVAGEGYVSEFGYSESETKMTDAYNNTITYKYTDKLLTEVIDQKGISLKYEFDSDKNVKKYTDRDGNTYEYKYDSNGNRTYEKDPLGYEVKTEYNTTFNKPTKEVNKLSDHVTEWKYDSKGNLKEIKNAKEDKRTFEYDDYGLLREQKDYNSNKTMYEYTPEGDVKKVIDAKNNVQEFTYDGIGRVSVFKNARGFDYGYKYDGNSNLKELSGPLGYKESYVYDKNNNMTEVVDANNGTSKTDYDKSANPTLSTDQLTFETNRKFGSMNEKKEELDAEGRLTTYSYDPGFSIETLTEAKGLLEETSTHYEYTGMKLVKQVTDGEGRIQKLEYDPLLRLKSETQNVTVNPADSENNVKTEYEYTATGKVSKIKDANGNSTSFKYDELDRLTELTDAENQITKYKYDAQSNLIKVTNPRSYETNYKYDELNRISDVTDAKNGVTHYEYDQNGNVIKVTDANSIATRFEYNELDRKSAMIQNAQDSRATNSDTNVKTTYEYDLYGNVIKVINPRTFATEFKYDAAHRLKDVIDSYNKVTKYDYDKVDNLLSIMDRNTHTKSFAYDGLNRTIQFKNEEGHAQEFAYDKVGNEIKFINERGKEFTSVYDALNRVKQVNKPIGYVTKNTYDPMGNLLSFSDENNHVDKFSYDKVYRLITSTDAEGNVTKIEYDKNSNKVKVLDGNGNPTNYGYDELDRLINETNAENETKEYDYDKTVNKTLDIEADGTNHTYKYDPLYRLVQVTNNFKAGAASNEDTNVNIHYSYDANGNMVATKNPLGNSTTFEFDKIDRMTSETNPIGSNWTYGYDNETNVTLRKDANGVNTNYAYYPDYMLKQITYPEYPVAYKYSETNYMTDMHDGIGDTNWKYDDLDRMTSQLDPFGKTLKYDVDGVGNVTKLTYPDNRTVSHTYLKNDWLRVSESSDKDKLAFTKDKVGNPTTIERSNATKATIAYDKVYRILEINDAQTSRNGSLVDKFNYSYNKVGHITTEKSTYGWRQPALVTTNYSYDGLHRLVNATDTDNSSTKYSYDAAGNRKIMEETLKQGVETHKYNYDAANELLAIDINSPKVPNIVDYDFNYDKNGNRVDKLMKDGTGVDRGTKYGYDTENRLIKAQDYQGQIVKSQVPSNQVQNEEQEPASYPVSYSTPVVEETPEAELEEYKINDLAHTDMRYDGNGRRLESTYFPGASQPGQTSKYTYDRLDPVVRYNMENGQRTNIYRDSGQNLMFYQDFKSEQAPGGTNYFYHYDGKGNISATTKQSGQSDHTYRLDEYGMPLPIVNGNNGPAWVQPHNEFVISQKEFDSNMDLYYFGSRFYDPSVGIWMNQDSYRGEMINPMSLHRYMYNYDSPVNYVDWYGYCSKPENIAKGCPSTTWPSDWAFEVGQKIPTMDEIEDGLEKVANALDFTNFANNSLTTGSIDKLDATGQVIDSWDCKGDKVCEEQKKDLGDTKNVLKMGKDGVGAVLLDPISWSKILLDHERYIDPGLNKIHSIQFSVACEFAVRNNMYTRECAAIPKYKPLMEKIYNEQKDSGTCREPLFIDPPMKQSNIA